jgi:hypothetical protein
LTRIHLALCCGLTALALQAAPASAQDPPPRIGPFVIDLHGTVPRFPDDPQLAASRGLLVGELPGAGLGLHGGVHVYPFSWKAVTFGLGVDLTLARARQGAVPLSPVQRARPVTEDFSHAAPQLSFNFGSGDGWSYLSGGIGPAVWSVVEDGSDAAPPDTERLQTINYGGGARWFTNRHMAFSVDVRFYAINPSTFLPETGLPTSPRTTLLIIGAGVSLK